MSDVPWPFDVSDEVDGSVSLEPDRAYDLPAGEHNGRAASLRVPCSSGPATLLLEDIRESHEDLMDAESPIEPGRQMESGTDWGQPTWRRLAALRPPLPF